MAETRDATANLTLAEIKARDIDNLTLIYQNARRHEFDDLNLATVFFGKTVNNALKKLGIDQIATIAQMKMANPGCNHDFLIKQLDKKMAEKEVRVESRVYGMKHKMFLDHVKKYKALGMEQEAHEVSQIAETCGDRIEDMWKSGIYIYHHNEIAYFISQPMSVRGGRYADSHIIVPGAINYIVTTNYRD